MLLGFAAVAVPAYLAFNWIVGTTVIQLGTLFAEKQVLYDRYRGLESLMREVSLAETLAGSQAVRDWARNEADPEFRQRGIAELEHFRQSFVDKSYFFAFAASGHYYFNDAANSYAGDQLRYTLDPANPRDAWYYKTAALGEGCHLNVDNDANLRVTKVWMNCVIREGRRVLGILGTGIDLTSFIQEVVNVPQVGVMSMFVDQLGQVQAHRDQDMIDLASLTREMSAKRTVFSMLDRPADAAVLRDLMDRVAAGETLVQSAFMQIGGKQMLVGVGYLDKLGWFNVTLMDIDTIIDRRLFVPIGLLLAGMMVLVALIIMLMFKRTIIRRLQKLESVVNAARAGNYVPAMALTDTHQDEIGRLSGAFTEMAMAVSDHTKLLEARVLARTDELAQIAFHDWQTGVANRRGFIAQFSALPADQHHGLLLIDIDHFKTVNDNYGHSAGDVVIIEAANRITQAIRPDDICGRWGGDEFIVLLKGTNRDSLKHIAERIVSGICTNSVVLANGAAVPVTVSVGACLVEPKQSIDAVAELADAALYMAKRDGRNKVVLLEQDSVRPDPAVPGATL